MEKGNITNKERFLIDTNGNWRNSIYLTCRVCKYIKNSNCGDILVSFDTNGKANLITVANARKIFGTEIDKSECLAEMSNAKFMCLFDKLIQTHTTGDKECPLLQLA